MAAPPWRDGRGVLSPANSYPHPVLWNMVNSYLKFQLWKNGSWDGVSGWNCQAWEGLSNTSTQGFSATSHLLIPTATFASIWPATQLPHWRVFSPLSPQLGCSFQNFHTALCSHWVACPQYLLSARAFSHHVCAVGTAEICGPGKHHIHMLPLHVYYDCTCGSPLCMMCWVSPKPCGWVLLAS